MGLGMEPWTSISVGGGVAGCGPCSEGIASASGGVEVLKAAV